MGELDFALIDDDTFAAIPTPAAPGTRCQTCDYWERVDGTRREPEEGATDAAARADLKRRRLLAGARLAGAYGMLAFRADAPNGAVGWAQFGPLSAYPRAQTIRDRYPELPTSPAPWVVTCLQVHPSVGDADERRQVGDALLAAVCADLERRGIGAVEAYPEGVADPWLPSSGPAAVYADAGFAVVAGDERYPVYRRELGGSAEDLDWGDLLDKARPADADDEGWPLRLPTGPSEDDLFRLPERPKRPNPFGED